MIQAQVSSKQAGFDEGGKILDFAVTVLMIGVGGLVGNTDGEKCQDGGDQVEPGVRGFGENAQAAGGDSHDNFQPGNHHRGQTEVPAAERFSARINSGDGTAGSRHAGIIAVGARKRQANSG